ncbi:toxin Tbo-IT2 [Neodiprion pinetum]|uniref:toxin Tbo-IT2-like n=1 Tax=Neodiprion fabricii TaxID=2872261 RepID=UPI001ED91029|nr:toxin Tbo-IT2-like [Neodiprion fabricii]XP_046427133.1 toxin Tbo-IT2-like [Neodiprion fabricii]XP_046427134.1 toxin Tbo-IT2-like [Neodiprion fabricii]XP_046427135.1 toxin Tbo-IT2-like [Neodiprion fabricii]XP_046427136.1 toxin Tbo-IT2-like [Neodiprion fabricii]XP_046483784.1 toxin Tbo-IT2-like [Neodiprion pinetum]XP_046483786.1 toxin Tbo-IT2-like [Neodiprion pinetum]XP_046483787.1 toxin Tbo-IT2-like [Neodiprion pinetum]XP_046483788.1 toxin Tbo-IT2-like [Neodiprion pinetum]XP_046483789.1 
MYKMKTSLLILVCAIFILLADRGYANPYFEDDETERIAEDDGLTESEYTDNALDRLLHAAQQKRGCVRRDGNCDHRRNDCCYNSSCRCNLWGSNCRCQRMGIFQKWG